MRRTHATIGSGQAVLVTGASSGYGKAVATYLATRGHLVFAGVRREVDGELVKRAGGSHAHNVVPLIVDVTDPSTIETSYQTVLAELEARRTSLFALVNNAGVGTASPLELEPISEIEWAMDVNFLGPIRMIQCYTQTLRETQGRIINVTSAGGRVAQVLTGSYAANKFALEGASDALRRELAPWGIGVHLIEPGNIDTGIHHRTIEKYLPRTRDYIEASKVSPAVGVLYTEMVQRQINALVDSLGISVDPNRGAALVYRILTSPRPRPRYLLGIDAKIVTGFFNRVLPDTWMDLVLTLATKQARFGEWIDVTTEAEAEAVCTTTAAALPDYPDPRARPADDEALAAAGVQGSSER